VRGGGGGGGGGDDAPRDDGDEGGGAAALHRPALPPDFPSYSLTDLKRMPAHKLLEMAETLELHEGVARMRKQDVTFQLLKVLSRHPNGVAADGVLEILPDGYGFLRSADASYLAGPDDVYISPSQIRRFNLRTGDEVTGRIRSPKDWRALRRAERARHAQRRAAGSFQGQGAVREPHAAVPAQALRARARQRFERGHHRPHHGSDGAAG
jgi:hypothetical protein